MMKLSLIAIFFVACNAVAGDLPDAKLTPGIARDVTVHELCTTSTKLVRHTSQAVKAAVYKEYGLASKHAPECTGPTHACYEIDHLISLEIGGADEQANLWPQLYDGNENAHIKDRLENELHRQVCTGKMTLPDVQSCISTNWIVCYKKVMP